MEIVLKPELCIPEPARRRLRQLRDNEQQAVAAKQLYMVGLCDMMGITVEQLEVIDVDTGAVKLKPAEGGDDHC